MLIQIRQNKDTKILYKALYSYKALHSYKALYTIIHKALYSKMLI